MLHQGYFVGILMKIGLYSLNNLDKFTIGFPDPGVVNFPGKLMKGRSSSGFSTPSTVFPVITIVISLFCSSNVLELKFPLTVHANQF